jgi:hypothetical protein
VLQLKNITRANTPDYDEYVRNLPPKNVGYPIIGSPDDVTEKFLRMHAAGLSGIAFSLVNYVDELPLIVDEVIPRLRNSAWRLPRYKTTNDAFRPGRRPFQRRVLLPQKALKWTSLST